MKTALTIVQGFTALDSAPNYKAVIASFSSINEEIEYLSNTTDANYVKAYVEHLVHQVVTAGEDEQAKKVEEKSNRFVAFVKRNKDRIIKGGFIFAAFLTMIAGFVVLLKKGKLSGMGGALSKAYASAIKTVQSLGTWIGKQMAALKAKTPEMSKHIKERLAKLSGKLKELGTAAKEAVKRGTDAAKQGAGKAGQAIKDGAGKAQQAVKDGATKVGDAAKKAAAPIKEKAGAIKNDVEKKMISRKQRKLLHLD